MRQLYSFLSVSVLFIAVIVTGCVSTSLQVDWKDPGFSGTFKKVLIICLVKDTTTIRPALESDLAAQFTQRGIIAVESNTLFISLSDVNREMVKRKVREIEADGVLLIRPVNHNINVYESYDGWDAYTDAPDQSLTAETYRVQTSLFETAKGKVVWRAVSDTIVGGAWTETLNNFAKVIGARLVEHGLI